MPDLDAVTIPQLQHRMDRDELTAVALTAAYLDRIAAFDGRIRAVIALDPTAPEQAVASDARRLAGTARGPLDGIPVLLKDNIDTADLPTTAGSRALAGAPPVRDAPVTALLRAAGAVVLGKANLSEWSNFRSPCATSGWSTLGGQTRNPHVLDRSPSGSSAGSAAAVAAALCQVAIGTETDGSILSPAGYTGIVGLKPTVGLVSSAGIVPISAEQDTAGPMGRTVIDVAITLGVLAGRPYPLRDDALRGARIGVWHPVEADAGIERVLAAAVAALGAAGATVVPVLFDAVAAIGEHERPALATEFRRDIEAYLRGRPDAPPTLAALIEANRLDPTALSVFGQERFEDALEAPGPDDPTYLLARAEATAMARSSIDGTLAAHDLIAIMAPTNGPAQPIDYAAGDLGIGMDTARPAAVAGYPSISVPAGAVGPLPLGVTFFAGRLAEGTLLDLAAGFEAVTRARLTPGLLATMPG